MISSSQEHRRLIPCSGKPKVKTTRLRPRGKPSRKTLVFASMCCVLLAQAYPASAAPGAADTLPPGAHASDIDRLVARAQQTFDVPGVAIGIVKDGKLIFAKGYGARAIDKSGAVDPNTLFGIASNTKAFTAAALAMLVDEGKLHWDDRVIDHLPGFRLYDPWVTRQFTVRDLLTHRSGLGLGAGDLMMFPHTTFTRQEIIHNLRYLKPASSFRSKFAYDNLLYLTAGQLIPAVTGMSWEDFIKTRILERLHMGCAPGLLLVPANADIARPHVMVSGKLTEIAPDSAVTLDPAGGIQCSVNGMAKWMIAQLDGGKITDGTRLFSEKQHEEMWTPQTIITKLPSTAGMTDTHFLNYGLGWFIEDYDGTRRIWHTGGLLGMVSYVSFIPAKHLGVVVLTNQQSGGAISSLMQSLLDPFLGKPQRDWIGYWHETGQNQLKEAAAIDQKINHEIQTTGGHVFLPLGSYAGVYHDPWRGDATVTKSSHGLRLIFSKTNDLQGELQPYKGNLFIVRWDDRSLHADALVHFETDFTGAVDGITMKALLPTTDFSFDFQDLRFTKTSADAVPEYTGN